MNIFDALSAPVRRDIVSMLADQGQLSVKAISERFNVSQPAISQHLKTLLEADVVHMQKQAQQRMYELNPIALKELQSWAQHIVSGIETLVPNVEERDLSTDSNLS